MRIIVISTPVFALTSPIQGLSHYGGLEAIAWWCAKGLAAKGHNVALVAPEGSVCDSVDIISIGPPGTWDEERVYDLYWKRLLEAECIIDHTWQKHSAILKMEGKLPNTPILGVMHAPCNTMYKELPPPGAVSFVCISKDQADHFKALYNNRDVRYVSNGIDTNFYKPLSVSRTNRFLFLARFSTIKGPDIAISTCKNIGVGLDLIGDIQITGEPEYLRRCLEMSDGKQIRFLGGRSRGECVYWFSQANCFLHPNLLFQEPLGLSPLEAQACGTPVCTFDNGAMRETVLNGETGWVVKTIEEFTATVKNVTTQGISNQMRKRCREWVCEHYNVQRMIDGYEKLCFEAVEKPW